MFWLDEYERRARLVPGLLVVVPIAVVITAVGVRQQPVVVLVVSLLSAAGMPVLLAGTVRDRGLILQERLFSKWGGPPTTQCLRHRGDAPQQKQRENWRSNVIHAVKHNLPTAEDEQRDPDEADALYEVAVSEVRQLASDRNAFPLVFEENRNFGFERNLLAMRTAGIMVACASSLMLIGAAILWVYVDWKLSLLSIIIGLVTCLSFLAIWIWVPNEDRVMRIGFRYAQRLLNSAKEL